MASDNTISELVPRTSISESDDTISALLSGANFSGSDDIVSEATPRKSTHKSDDTISESIAESDKAHGFLDVLPRELRDQIYDLIFQETEKVVNGWHYKIRTASSTHRLISRQFTKEYDQRPPINNIIEASECELVDHECPCTDREDGQSWFPTSLPAQTTTLHINLIMCQCLSERIPRCLKQGVVVPAEMHEHYEYWLETLVRVLPLLKKVTMSVSCGNFKCAMALQSFTEEIWPSIPNLSRITLLSLTYDYDYSAKEWVKDHRESNQMPHHSDEFFERQRRQAMATWTPAHGWQANAKVTERCRREDVRYWSWSI
jgi:hypothetical protein